MKNKFLRIIFFLIFILTGVFNFNSNRAQAIALCSAVGDPGVTFSINGNNYTTDSSVQVASGNTLTFTVYTVAEPGSQNNITYPGGSNNYVGPNATGRTYTTSPITTNAQIAVFIAQNCQPDPYDGPTKTVTISLQPTTNAECVAYPATWTPASPIPWKTTASSQYFTLNQSYTDGSSTLNHTSSCTTGTSNDATCTASCIDTTSYQYFTPCPSVTQNFTTCQSPVNRIDTLDPICPSPSSANWSGSGPTYTLSGATDAPASGISGQSGINVAGGTCTASAGSSCSVTITDLAGNSASCSSPVYTVQPHTVTASYGSGGTVSPGSRSVVYGDTTFFSVNSSLSSIVQDYCPIKGSFTSGSVYTTGAITQDCNISFSFTSSSIIDPSVTTNSATNVTQTSAALNGNITNTGGVNATQRGFDFGTSTSYGSPYPQSGSFGTGNFTQNVSGLTCNTAYHFRAYAVNSVGTGAGTDVTFTTSPCPSMTGTLVPASSSCTIALGQSSCTVGSTWSVASPESASSAITATGMSNINLSGTSGSQTLTVPYSSRTFYLYNNAKSLVPTSPNGAGITVTSSCDTGTFWNGTICATSSSPINGACSVPAVAYTCDAGTSSGTTGDTSTQYRWDCNGSNGGVSVSCTAPKSSISYSVAATAGPNGSISPASRTVTAGNTTTFTVTPNTGYTSLVSGCGGSLAGNTYTTGPINAECAVLASFVQENFTSGTLSASPANCSINSGANSCTSTLTWNTSYPVGTSTVSCPGATPSSITANSGSQSITISHSSPTVNCSLVNNSSTLATTIVSANCASGTTWNAVKNMCQTTPGSPVNGVCGVSVNACQAGILSDIPDSATQYLWNCNGENGGSNTSPSCSEDKPVMSGSLTASNCTIASGASSCNTTLAWNTTNPVGISNVTSNRENPNTVVGNGNSGTVSIPVTFYPVQTSFGLRDFFLNNNGETLASATAYATCVSGTSWIGGMCQPPLPPVPVVTISVSPASGPAQTINPAITWSATNNPTSCTFSGNWTNTNGGAVSGTSVSQGVLPIQKIYNYSLVCSNAGGDSAEATAMVVATIPVPIVTISATPSTGTTGSINPAITWSATNNPSSCTASGDWNGSKPVSGSSVSQGVLPSAGTYTYTLTCSNISGAGPAGSAYVVASPPTGPDLTASLPTPATAQVGVPQTYNSTISNVGNESTNASFSYFFQTSTEPNGGGTLNDLPSSTVSALAAGGTTAAVSPAITADYPGTFYVRVCADKTNSASSGVVSETNENNNCSDWRDVAVSGTAPLAPTNLSASAGSCGTGMINLSWNASTGAESYKVLRSTTSGSGYTLLASGIVGTSYTDSNSLTPSTGYYYVVQAVNTVGTSPNSAQASATAPPFCLLPDLTVLSLSPTTATVNVAQNYFASIKNNGEVSASASTSLFQVSSSASGSNPTNYSVATPALGDPYGSVPNSTTIFKSLTFSSAGTYYLRVCADLPPYDFGVVNEFNENNNCYAWTPIVVTTVPVPVVTISANPASGVVNVVNPALTWSATNNPTSCAFTGGDWTNTNGDAVSGTNISQGVLTQIKTYTYTMTCTNTNGTGGPSSATVTVTAPLAPDLTASVTSPNTGVVNVAQNYTATISNIGTTSATGTITHLYQFDEDANHASGNETTSIVQTTSTLSASGGSVVISTPHTFTSVGTKYMRACADNNASFVGTVTESNEGNNCSSSWTAVNVAAALPPGIDLTASATTPTTATVGVPQIYSSTISNLGDTSTGQSFSNFFQVQIPITNRGLNVEDLPATPMPALGAGASNVTTQSYTYTFTTNGKYPIRACADKTDSSSQGVIAESNEGNNCGPWTDVIVTDLPVSMSGTLTPAVPSCTIPLGASSCNINFSWTTTNPVGTSEVTKAPSVTVATGNNGTNVPFAVKYNFETFYLYNDGVQLALSNVFSSCASGTEWDPGTGKCIATPIDGVCDIIHWACVSGTSVNNRESATDYTWDCNGINGGSNAFPSCVELKNGVCGNGIVESGEDCDYGDLNGDSEPVGCSTSCKFNTWGGGVCALKHNNCTKGNYNGDAASGVSAWTWSCGGASCLEFKKIPIFIED